MGLDDPELGVRRGNDPIVKRPPAARVAVHNLAPIVVPAIPIEHLGHANEDLQNYNVFDEIKVENAYK